MDRSSSSSPDVPGDRVLRVRGADRRRRGLVQQAASVIVAHVIMGISFVATGLVTSVPLILGAAALMGFGWTFKSGAIDAWLADEVGAERLGREYQRGAQVARVLGLLGIAAAVGLALVDLRLPIVVGGLVLLALGALLAFVMPESASSRGLAELSAASRAIPPSPAARSSWRVVPLLVLGISSSAVCGARASTGGEAQFHANMASPSCGVQLDHLVRDPQCRRCACSRSRSRSRSAPLRERELERHDVEPLLARQLWWRSRSVRARRQFRRDHGAVLAAICVARSLAAPSLLDLAQREHRGHERARDRDLDDEPRRLGGSVGRRAALGLVGIAFGIRAPLAPER